MGFGIAAAVFIACDNAPTAQPPSLLLITIDTLRSDHLAGAGLDNTPVLAALSKKGTRFTWAFSAAPTTAPSHVSLLTGKYPGFHTVGTRNGEQKLHDSAQTLAEALQQNGYRTAAILSNPMLKKRLGLDQGFDSYDDDMQGAELNRGVSEQYADRAIDKAVAWLEAKPSGPFFLWLHLQDPHGPYDPPEGTRCTSPLASGSDTATLPVGDTHLGEGEIPAYQAIQGIRDVATYKHRYACELAYLDAELGRFIRLLESKEDTDNLLTIITSDHGEAMGEDGFWFAHGHSIGVDQVHVPLIAIGPGFPANRTVEVPVSNVATFATALDVLGISASASGASDLVGPSLAAIARSGADARNEAIFVESVSQVGVIQDGVFLRRDRQLDDAFWAQPIGDSGGTRKRGGEHIVALEDSRASEAAASREVLSHKLIAYVGRVGEIEATISLLREAASALSSEEEDALRALGYLE
jgi:arylsulfatase A-like enzyme